jgi:hypothetical protein
MVSLEVEAAMGIVMPVNFFFFFEGTKKKGSEESKIRLSKTVVSMNA